MQCAESACVSPICMICYSKGSYHYFRNSQGVIKLKKSAVYFTDFHATPNGTLPQKLHRLMKRAGFEEISFADRFTAIKIHFGELGNLAYLRPQYAKVVADYVRELGGQVFLTDCNTLYVGSRLDKHIKLFWEEDPNHEYFHLNHPDAEWEAGLIHAEEIGLGTRQYELIKI